MKSIALICLSIILINPNLARADAGHSQLTDLDSFIKGCKVSFIGECLPINETNVVEIVKVRNMRVVDVLQGSYTPGKNVIVLARTPLVPGRYYLICGNENTRGELMTWQQEESEVEIQVWGETKGQKEYQLAGFIKGLDGKPFKEQLEIIFKQRLAQLKAEEEKTKREMEVLDKALKQASDVGDQK
jgi:hypothetical protein